jgi:hypothetical protein
MGPAAVIHIPNFINIDSEVNGGEEVIPDTQTAW